MFDLRRSLSASEVTGSGKVDLLEREGGTLLSYRGDAQIGGELARLGQLLVNGTAKKLADEFFQFVRAPWLQDPILTTRGWTTLPLLGSNVLKLVHDGLERESSFFN